jgi:hypothetical protein
MKIARLLSPNTTTLNISNKYPADIIAMVTECDLGSSDYLLLESDDVWRYADDAGLVSFLTKLSCVVVIAHNGYKHTRLAENVFNVALLDHLIVETCVMNTKQHWHKLKTESTKYGFSSLNNRIALHRLLLGYELNKHNLLHDVIFTQNTYGNIHGYETKLFFNLPFAKDYMEMLPLMVDEVRGEDGFVNDRSSDHIAFSDAFCNIVTESETEFFGHDIIYPTPTVSEKSFKPFDSFQIPIFLAAQGHMAYFRELGFYTFDDLFAIDFDNAGTFEKVDEIIRIVDKGTEYIRDYYFSHINEIQHNYDRSVHVTDVVEHIEHSILAFINS